jgi:hypothetical protein
MLTGDLCGGEDCQADHSARRKIGWRGGWQSPQSCSVLWQCNRWSGIVRRQFGSKSAARIQQVPLCSGYNFLPGFVYIVAGTGLLLCRRWARLYLAVRSGFTILVFVALAFTLSVAGDVRRADRRCADDQIVLLGCCDGVSMRAMKSPESWSHAGHRFLKRPVIPDRSQGS